LRLVSNTHSSFRGLQDGEHEFSNINLVLGNNGDGKTSLLESIYVSMLGTPLNSFARAGRELSRNNEGLFSAESKAIDHRGNTTIYKFSSTNNGRMHLTDDKKTTIRDAYLSNPVCLINS
jgi:Recombinational DNA repair ATPase (RecF pathway)